MSAQPSDIETAPADGEALEDFEATVAELVPVVLPGLNGDFADSLLLVARTLGGQPDATTARIASGEIDNIHFNPDAGRIPDEADFNDLFRTFDVAWAAYEGFQGSSGTDSVWTLLTGVKAFNVGDAQAIRAEYTAAAVRPSLSRATA